MLEIVLDGNRAEFSIKSQHRCGLSCDCRQSCIAIQSVGDRLTQALEDFGRQAARLAQLADFVVLRKF